MTAPAVPAPTAPPPPLGARRLLAAAAPDLATHLRVNGPVPWRGGVGRLVGDVQSAGLTGRGGAGFPTWRKLTAVAGGTDPVVIGNAAEGEPASAKDRTLLRRAPHLVLDGLQLAAETVGARTAYLYVPAGPAHAAADAALRQRKAQRWDRIRVRLVTAPGTFVAGQETAVLAHLEGRPALPRDADQLAVHAGLRGRPTLVQNVETLAHLAQIARYGARWFRGQGTAAEPGTFLATVSGAVRSPGVHEVPIGIPVAALLDVAGGVGEPVRAVLVGGFHGSWLPMASLGHLPVSVAGLRPVGGSPGAGVVLALPSTACGLRESARIARYLAEQSAGQCGPCRFGLPSLAATLTAVADGDRDPALPHRMHGIARLVEGRGACHHPDGTVRFVRSALAAFDADLHAHLSGHCLAEGPLR